MHNHFSFHETMQVMESVLYKIWSWSQLKKKKHSEVPWFGFTEILGIENFKVQMKLPQIGDF